MPTPGKKITEKSVPVSTFLSVAEKMPTIRGSNSRGEGIWAEMKPNSMTTLLLYPVLQDLERKLQKLARKLRIVFLGSADFAEFLR